MIKRLIIILLASLCFVMPIYADELEVEAEYAYLVNRDTKEVLYDKNGKDVIYPASMTKMMTVIVALENHQDLSEKVKITSSIINKMISENASMAGFWAGDEVSILDLCYGALLPSGGECVEALALSVCDTIDEYVELMNQKAKELHMNSTHFVNTTGLHDENHISSCYDLCLLLDYCLDNDVFKEIFTSREHTSEPVASNRNGVEMHSTTLYMLSDKCVMKGAKSGFTYPAGRCLASFSENEETYLLIVAKAPVDNKISQAVVDSLAIYDYVYENFDMTTFNKDGEVLTKVDVLYDLDHQDMPISLDHDLVFTYPKGSSVNVVMNELAAPLYKGDVIGTYRIIHDQDILYSEDIVLNEDILGNWFTLNFWNIAYYFYLNPSRKYQILYGLSGLLVLVLLALIVRKRVH